MINDPLQKTSGVFHSNLQMAHLSKFLHSVINRTKLKAVKPLDKWQVQRVQD